MATEHAEIERRLIAGPNGSLAHPAVLMNRQAVAAGLYRSQYEWVEDLDLWLRSCGWGKSPTCRRCCCNTGGTEGSVCASRREGRKPFASRSCWRRRAKSGCLPKPRTKGAGCAARTAAAVDGVGSGPAAACPQRILRGGVEELGSAM